MRPLPFWLMRADVSVRPYLQKRTHLPYSVIIVYYSFDFGIVTLFAFVLEEKEYLCWLFLVDLLYHLTATTQLAPF